MKNCRHCKRSVKDLQKNQSGFPLREFLIKDAIKSESRSDETLRHVRSVDGKI